jgi:hypothetical protein
VLRIQPFRIGILEKLSQSFVLEALDHGPSTATTYVKRHFTYVNYDYTRTFVFSLL